MLFGKLTTGIVVCVLATSISGPADGILLGATDPSTRPIALTIVVESWKPRWQPAPDGDGDYLLSPAFRSEVQSAHRQYVAMKFGVLVRELSAPDGWEIIPELYQRDFQLFEIQDGMLWAVEKVSPRAQTTGGLRLVALDLKNWSTRKSFTLPANSRVVKVEATGCWFLQNQISVYNEVREATGYASLVYQDWDGREKLRFNASSPTTTTPDVNSMFSSKPLPLIYWWAIDSDAAYLSVVDYRGVGPHDGLIYGPTRQLVRIDRISGESVIKDAPVDFYTLLVNTPKRLLWLDITYEMQRPVNSIYQFDKQTKQVSRVGILDAGTIDSLAADSNHVWAREVSGKVRAYSIHDLKEVPQQGQPPSTNEFSSGRNGPVGAARNYADSLAILGGDKNRLWLARGKQIIELPDDGQPSIRDLAGIADGSSIWPIASKPGTLYIGTGSQAFRLTSGDSKVLCAAAHTLDDYYYGTRAAAGRFLWTCGPNSQLQAVTDGLVPGRRFSRMSSDWAVTAGNDIAFYFAQADGNPGLMRADPVTGEQAPVASWKRYASQWSARSFDLPIDSLLRPLWMSAEDGKIHILYHQPSSPTRDVATFRLMLWTYNIAEDRWDDTLLPQSYAVLESQPGLVYDTKEHVIRSYRQGKWISLARAPAQWYGDNSSTPPIHVTDRYLYARTPLGIWRKPIALDAR